MLGRTLLAAAALFASSVGAAAAVPADDAPPVTVTLTTTTSAAPATAPAPALGKPVVTFVASGHGWGHGLGLSQWGAKGYADHGWTYDAILAHYYPGTTLGPAPATQLRVLLADGAKSLALGSTGGWTLVDGDGASHPLQPGKLALGTGLQLRTTASARATPLSPPLSLVPQSGAQLQYAGKAYRGSFRVEKTKAGRLQLIDEVGLEDYLKGVVPAEMPSGWAPEALKAQAVAARSYALAQLAPARSFDVYGDTRDQAYGGIAAESPAASAAVDATAGQVLLYGGKVADALYSSSSGGRTAASSEGFPGKKPVPYLVSVPDPYDVSPYRNWGPVAVDGTKAAKALGVTAPLEGVAPSFGPSGRVTTAVVTTPTGPVVSTGPALRSAFGLRSSWFSLGLLSLQAPAGAVPYGSSVTISGVARDVASPLLEQRAGSVFWTPGPAIAPAGDGSFAFAVRPLRTTWFRLGTGSLRGAALKVPVAPVVAFAAGNAGTVKPVVAGKNVDVQQQVGRKWRTVASVPVDASGAFSAGTLPPATYRARYAPGAGLAAGVSAPLAVSG
ncbi:MAG TPA: SpoIID/LytB domain-containing protein [Gaiellaceae bacterium]|nr:SpoIID/LytB domain-containing protein [Gaiellaceae bacterium]